MDNKTASSTEVAGDNFQLGDRVTITVHPIFAGMSGEITALPSPDAGIVALDGGTRERIPLECLGLVRESSISLMSNDVPVGTSFNVEVLDNVVDRMSQAEAMQCVEQINHHCHQIRYLLVELDSRQGYLALGFPSMSGLMRAQLFDKARSTLQKELQAGRREKDYLNVPVGTMPERHLRPLSKLKPEYYSVALSQAGEIAGNRPITEKDVSAAVATMLLTDKHAAKRSIVDVVKERTHVPLCDRTGCQVDDVIKVRAFKNVDLRSYDGYWEVIQHVGNNFSQVYISPKGETIGCREEEVEYMDISEGDRISLLSVSSRISNLLKAELEAVDYAILETIQRSLYLTPRQMMHLELMEKDDGVSSAR